MFREILQKKCKTFFYRKIIITQLISELVLIMIKNLPKKYLKLTCQATKRDEILVSKSILLNTNVYIEMK